MLLRATFGVLVSHDGGKNWDWICEQAIGYSGSSDPSFGYTQGGTILVAISTGLALSNDRGCGWGFASVPMGANNVFSDVAVRPDQPSAALALLSGFLPSDGGPPQWNDRLYATGDDGKNWTPGFTFDPSTVGTTVEVGGAPSPLRIYVSATRSPGTPQVSGVLFVSDDNGGSFIERAIPIDSQKETGVYIAGVDPTNADRIYVRTNSPLDKPYNRLFVSEDAGKNWKTIFTGGALRGFAQSGDGAKIYVGGPVNGIQVANRSDFVFAQTNAMNIECLAMQAGVLWACGTVPFALGTSTDDGKTFTTVLQLNQIRGQLACAANTTTSTQCTQYWPVIRDTLKIDAGVADAGPPPPKTSGCNCNASASDGSPWIALLAWVASRARRRKLRA